MLIKDARSPRGRFEPDVQRTHASWLRPVYGVMEEGESWRSEGARRSARAFLFPPKEPQSAGQVRARRRELARQYRLNDLDHHRQLDRERHRRFRERRRAA